MLTFVLQRFVRNYLRFIAYRNPPRSGFTPDRLYAWLDTVWHRRHIDGDILEIGCDECGTSYLTHQFLRRTGVEKRYVCVDTFNGFVPAQFDSESKHGLSQSFRFAFAHSSIDYVRGKLAKYGASEIELVKGDIASIPDSMLPTRVAVCLLDVDLEIPIYEGLKRVFPRLAAGGAILIDDCEEGSMWRARKGWQQFIQENGLPEKRFMGMGLIEKAVTSRTRVAGVDCGAIPSMPHAFSGLVEGFVHQ
jgi:O-methyltransferase